MIKDNLLFIGFYILSVNVNPYKNISNVLGITE